MTKRKKVWGIVIRCAIAAAIVAAVTVLIVMIAGTQEGDTPTEAFVSRGTLATTVSSSGVVKEISSTTAIPLAALIYEVDDITELENATYETNWASILLNAQQAPLAWRVDRVESVIEEPLEVNEETPETELLTLTPVYFNWEKYREAYESATAEEGNAAVVAYVLNQLFSSSAELGVSTVSEQFLTPRTEDQKVVSTDFVNRLIRKTVAEGTELEYTLSRVTYREGDYLTPANTLLSATYRQTFVSYTVSEYDYQEIAASLRAEKNVYAVASVNALNGEKVLAQVQKSVSSFNSNGVSYYSVLAKLVFGHEETVTDPDTGLEKPHVDFTYYKEELDDEFVTRLGLSTERAVTPEEVLDNFSVTVTSQKNPVENTLIVKVKCIYYNDSKQPYVVLLDERGKEKRAYVTIILSTGTEAAVEPLEGYTLSEGDKVKYEGDATLLSSLF